MPNGVAIREIRDNDVNALATRRESLPLICDSIANVAKAIMGAKISVLSAVIFQCLG
jgi:hypothetical protein